MLDGSLIFQKTTNYGYSKTSKYFFTGFGYFKKSKKKKLVDSKYMKTSYSKHHHL
jgi:hypothetical protein